MSVLYENGDIEQLATHDIIRDGLLSLGWVNPPGSPPADSDNCLSPGAASAAGDPTSVSPFSLFLSYCNFHAHSGGISLVTLCILSQVA